MFNPRTVLFDLDGTLLDTAPDMAYALNQQRLQHGLHELSYSSIRPHVSHGAKSLIGFGFDLKENDPAWPTFIEEYLDLYQLHVTSTTRLFPHMEKVLEYLENQHIPWGIVTNKPSRFAFEILRNLDLEIRTVCVVCGDSLPKRKPDPEPLLFACKQISQEPSNCLYIGDSQIDVQASKAAGIKSLIALYGYINSSEDPFTWQADGYIRDPLDIIPWLRQHPSS